MAARIAGRRMAEKWDDVTDFKTKICVLYKICGYIEYPELLTEHATRFPAFLGLLVPQNFEKI